MVLLVGIGFSASFGLTFAGLMVFTGMVPTMFGAAQRVMGAYTTYQSVAPNAASTYELLDTRPSVQDRADAVALGDVHGNLVFEDVAFGYAPEQNVLDGLSFSISEGETVALVGGIGSGKSTVFNLLLRFLDPQQGRILLDGHDIAGVTIASLRDQVSKLAQFPFFVKDTIRENIRLARPDASDADIEEACEEAHVHSVITDPSKMHDGYDTVVDVQVPSGGQKRLIALARCLLRKPEVLLLDEPTENLDADQRAQADRRDPRLCARSHVHGHQSRHGLHCRRCGSNTGPRARTHRTGGRPPHADGRGRPLQTAVRGAERRPQSGLSEPDG